MTLHSVATPLAFDTHHDDVIHDAKVDFYGRRLATASSDRTIRIFQVNQSDPETLLSVLSGHEGPVWQVAWAHPKFGSYLASGSYDGSVIVWKEEQSGGRSSKPLSAGGSQTVTLWTKAKVHRFHEASVNSIAFAPHQYGLHLACASSDGKISILSHDEAGSEWQVAAVFDAHQSGCNAVSWCPAAEPSTVFSPSFQALEPLKLGAMRLASAGCDNLVKIWAARDGSTETEADADADEPLWKLEATLAGHTDWVRDVCWRPSLGQAGRMLVSCSQDCTVLIWRQDKDSAWFSRLLKAAPFVDTLWRVSFSEYGNLLAVSCGDNTVTLWHQTPESGEWESAGTVNESVTESVAISEPSAIQQPELMPLPVVNFGSAGTRSSSPVKLPLQRSPVLKSPAIVSPPAAAVLQAPAMEWPQSAADVKDSSNAAVQSSYEPPTYQPPSPFVEAAAELQADNNVLDEAAIAPIGSVSLAYEQPAYDHSVNNDHAAGYSHPDTYDGFANYDRLQPGYTASSEYPVETVSETVGPQQYPEYAQAADASMYQDMGGYEQYAAYQPVTYDHYQPEYSPMYTSPEMGQVPEAAEAAGEPLEQQPYTTTVREEDSQLYINF